MHHKNTKRMTAGTPEYYTEQLRQEIAVNLQVDPDRIRYAPLDGKERGKLGTSGNHWQIFYRDEWREIPWHNQGPTVVTRDMIRATYG